MDNHLDFSLVLYQLKRKKKKKKNIENVTDYIDVHIRDT